ncbi:MAG: hypothetical protein CNCCGFBP_01544 [Fimbriimonadaceae bacterium]|nr:hypothetical protein [Fimbriimonadaceae bacterium]
MTGGLKGRDTIGRMPQSLATVLVHAVFSTKDRTPWLAPAIRQELHPYIVGVLANIGCPSIQTGGVEDHVHALCCRSMNGICGIESRPFRPHPLLRHFLCPGLRPSLLDERPFGPTWRQGRPPARQARGQDAGDRLSRWVPEAGTDPPDFWHEAVLAPTAEIPAPTEAPARVTRAPGGSQEQL